MEYYVYKINLLCGDYNGKFYIGKHQSTSLKDNYFGSGTELKHYYEKYGCIENYTFTKEILEVVDNELTLIRAEYDYIQRSYNDMNCINLHPGDYIQTTDEVKRIIKNLTENVQFSWICNIFAASSKTNTMSKCIILSRVSSFQQTLDSQTEAIKKEAMKEGFRIEDMIIIEDKESAIKLSEEERHGLNTMKENIENDKDITHVFVYELSRVSRRQLVLFSIRDYLIQNGIQLVCCQPYFKMLEDGKLSQTANLMFSIFASMAESEMQLKQERMMRGRQYNKMTGKIAEGKPMMGYKLLDDKTIIVDEEEKEFVIELFTLYATGMYSVDGVAKELAMRHCEMGMEWKTMRNKIAWMLRCERYCGDSQYPQLISRELFEKARAAAKANTSNNKNFEKCDALLKKIIYSRATGYRMTYAALPRKHRYVTNNETPMVTVMVKHIDPAVWQLAQILHKEYVLDSGKIRKQMKAKIDTNFKKMMNMNISLKKAREKIDKIEERVINGKLSEERAAQMEADIEKSMKIFENELAKIEEETSHMKQLMSSSTVVELPDYESFSQEEKIQLIRQMISRIDIEKPSRFRTNAYIETNVDGFLYIIEINTKTGDAQMTSRGLSDLRK